MSNNKNQKDLNSLLECKSIDGLNKSIDHLLEQNNIDDILLDSLIQKVEVLRDKSS
ncbi:hypothetical protein [Companilactobacillus baiquanensis]|uniref:Uncharacterized protein n=1 Tax=Companilactobacillus baiquanensis TaxID=2486005 RepID=A0ABW1UWB3_9LACO|nr:hypothetical protein [Companilactobacillus baiquanensis]